MFYTLTNSFHGTQTRVRPTFNGTEYRLNKSQVARAWRKLCGISGCTCGGPCGERGGISTQSLPSGGAVVYA